MSCCTSVRWALRDPASCPWSRGRSPPGSLVFAERRHEVGDALRLLSLVPVDGGFPGLLQEPVFVLGCGHLGHPGPIGHLDLSARLEGLLVVSRVHPEVTSRLEGVREVVAPCLSIDEDRWLATSLSHALEHILGSRLMEVGRLHVLRLGSGVPESLDECRLLGCLTQRHCMAPADSICLARSTASGTEKRAPVAPCRMPPAAIAGRRLCQSSAVGSRPVAYCSSACARRGRQRPAPPAGRAAAG